MLQRLNKYLAQQGIASRRAADRLIVEGRVSVNRKIVEDLGVKIDPESDKIAVDGKGVAAVHEMLYIMLHKPVGCLVTKDDPEGRPTVMDLIPKLKTPVFPVGRLDYNSEGLLLLTNDGELAYRLTHPRYEIVKKYAVQVTGEVTPADAARLQKGIFVEGHRTAPARIKIFEHSPRRSILLVEIHEGRKREVRQMLEGVGHPVQTLKRVEFAGLRLAPLTYGKWRFLKKQEVQFLRQKVRLERPKGEKAA
jgi:23S rRNA pseudouridine2605 synthase